MKFSPAITAILAAAMALPSCLSHTDMDKETGAIRLNPVIGEVTRVGGEISSFPTNGIFRLWAVTADGGKFLDNSLCSYSPSEGWTPSGSPDWPYKQSLRFVAYYPETLRGVTCDGEGVIRLDSYDMDGTDILFTDLTASQTWSERSTVELPFHHLLAKIDFRVLQTVGSDVDIRVKKIFLDGVRMSGSYDSSSRQKWTPSGDAIRLPFYADSLGTEVKTLAAAYIDLPQLVLPQSNDDAAITVEFTYKEINGTEISVTTSSRAAIRSWEPGRHYTYTLSIDWNSDSRTFSLKNTTAISSWDSSVSPSF